MSIRGLIVPFVAVATFAVVVQAAAQGAFPAPLPGAAAQGNASPFPPVNTAPAAAKPSPFPPVNGAPAAARPSPFPPVNQTAAAPAASPFPPVNAPPSSSAFTGGAAPITGGFTPAAPPPGQQQAGGDKCMQEFMPLRQDAERRGQLIKKASDRGAPPSEACKLIGNYAQSEARMIKYVNANGAACGIPAEIKKQLETSHKNTEQLRRKVCSAAAQAQQPRGPAAPSLSQALGTSVSAPQPTTTKRRGGAFDTLSGNALQR